MQSLAKAILERARGRTAERATGTTGRGPFPPGPLGTIRRKYLINQARRIAWRFNLQEELDGFVYAAGFEAITGLEAVELEALVEWLQHLGDRVETACDRWDAPPAR